jgi:hypothetical protein
VFCGGRAEYLCTIPKKVSLRKLQRKQHDGSILVSSLNPHDAKGDQLTDRHNTASSSVLHNIMSYTYQSILHVLVAG